MTVRGKAVSWVHKFFWCQKQGTQWVCRYQIKNTNFWLPRSFTWTIADDTDTLKVYIDALVTRNKTVSTLWEEKGAAIHHEYIPEPEGGVVRLDAVKLTAILRGEFVLDVPAYGRVVMSDGGHKSALYMPQEVQASIIADGGPVHEFYMKRLQELVGAHLPIVALEKDKFKGGEAKVQCYSPGAAIAVPMLPASDVAPSDIPAVPNETEIARFEHEGYIEIISTLDSYFTRRLATLDGTPFWGGSSYSSQGPWKQFFINDLLYSAVLHPEATSV